MSCSSHDIFRYLQVLITEAAPRESLVQENGKVVLDDGQTNPLLQFPFDFYDIKKEERPLKLRKKLYEFYTAPISKFWGHSVRTPSSLLTCSVCFFSEYLSFIKIIQILLLQIAYIIFLYTFSYVVLVHMPSMPSWPELYVIGYITAFGCEKLRELLSAEPVGLRYHSVF